MKYLTLHISQPTVSRDIDFKDQKCSEAKRKNLAHRYYYEQQNAFDDVGELMKNLWLIIDNPKIEEKERMKAMKLMMHGQYMLSKLIDSECLPKTFTTTQKK
jgi:hypothetical protein